MNAVEARVRKAMELFGETEFDPTSRTADALRQVAKHTRALCYHPSNENDEDLHRRRLKRWARAQEERAWYSRMYLRRYE